MGSAGEQQKLQLRVLTSVAKLTTGRHVVEVLSEVIEAFGGAGYVEDTGLPALLRDAHVLPIWEGTTNVLALDTLRALAQPGAWEAIIGLAEQVIAGIADPALLPALWEALQPGGRLVANVVSSEGERAILDWQARHGGELCRIAVSRCEPLGGHHGWRPLLPVTQLVATKPR